MPRKLTSAEIAELAAIRADMPAAVGDKHALVHSLFESGRSCAVIKHTIAMFFSISMTNALNSYKQLKRAHDLLNTSAITVGRGPKRAKVEDDDAGAEDEGAGVDDVNRDVNNPLFVATVEAAQRYSDMVAAAFEKEGWAVHDGVATLFHVQSPDQRDVPVFHHLTEAGRPPALHDLKYRRTLRIHRGGNQASNAVSCCVTWFVGSKIGKVEACSVWSGDDVAVIFNPMYQKARRRRCWTDEPVFQPRIFGAIEFRPAVNFCQFHILHFVISCILNSPPVQILNNDEYFAYFEHIFERLIKMNYKYSKIIGL